MSIVLGGLSFQPDGAGRKLISTHPTHGGIHSIQPDGSFVSEYPVPKEGYGTLAPGSTLRVSGANVTKPEGFTGDHSKILADNKHDLIASGLEAAFAGLAPSEVPMGVLKTESMHKPEGKHKGGKHGVSRVTLGEISAERPLGNLDEEGFIEGAEPMESGDVAHAGLEEVDNEGFEEVPNNGLGNVFVQQEEVGLQGLVGNTICR